MAFSLPPRYRWAAHLLGWGLVYLVMGALLHGLIGERTPTREEYPKAGDVLVNAVAGERVVFRAAPKPFTDGLSRLDVTLNPMGAVPVAHIHPDSVETFVVKRGRVVATLDGVEHTLGPGDRITVPAGRAHALRNGTDEIAEVEVELAPTGRMHLALTQVHGYLHEAGASPGIGGFLQMLRFAERYHVYLDGPPIWLQKFGIFALAPTARLLGYAGFDPRYAALSRARSKGEDGL